jgi:hypothetical protein
LLTQGTADLFVDPFEESYQNDVVEGETFTEAEHASKRGDYLKFTLANMIRISKVLHPERSETVHTIFTFVLTEEA